MDESQDGFLGRTPPTSDANSLELFCSAPNRLATDSGPAKQRHRIDSLARTARDSFPRCGESKTSARGDLPKNQLIAHMLPSKELTSDAKLLRMYAMPTGSTGRLRMQVNLARFGFLKNTAPNYPMRRLTLFAVAPLASTA